mgnify:CR=1 FL=1
MKFSERAKAAWGVLRGKSASNEWTELNNLYKFLGIDVNADDKVLSEATYFACQKILSEAIGKLPLKLLRYNDKNGVMTMRKHYLYKVLLEI